MIFNTLFQCWQMNIVMSLFKEITLKKIIILYLPDECTFFYKKDVCMSVTIDRL